MLCRPEIADAFFTRVRLWEDEHWRLSAVLQGAIPGFAHLETPAHPLHHRSGRARGGNPGAGARPGNQSPAGGGGRRADLRLRFRGTHPASALQPGSAQGRRRPPGRPGPARPQCAGHRSRRAPGGGRRSRPSPGRCLDSAEPGNPEWSQLTISWDPLERQIADSGVTAGRAAGIDLCVSEPALRVPTPQGTGGMFWTSAGKRPVKSARFGPEARLGSGT